MLKLGIHPVHPAAPINQALALESFIAFLMLLFFVLVRSVLSVERPGSAQHLVEIVHEFVCSQGEAIIGHGYEPHVAIATIVLVFLLCCNFTGLLPGIDSVTSDPVVPLGVALVVFLYYHWNGVRAQGPIGYLKHFAGPVWWIAPLLFPIEIISHFARIMSLTIRLYANMFASDLLTLVFFSMIPIGIPIIFLGLHFAVSVIQAYVFMLLTLIYLSQAVAHEH
ncbi:F0F1 ATP synthase subunit A [Acidipila sp. 4G-K13]|uniref:ATP synthase subunit a n=2 Tax=Paracidobacterium acidisoli TaxID=2303751 RepID=A0A372IU61_9BACT|nr:F0F1 ATP synthase subunit A [Paracidobacterium acidisoli]